MRLVDLSIGLSFIYFLVLRVPVVVILWPSSPPAPLCHVLFHTFGPVSRCGGGEKGGQHTSEPRDALEEYCLCKRISRLFHLFLLSERARGLLLKPSTTAGLSSRQNSLSPLGFLGSWFLLTGFPGHSSLTGHPSRRAPSCFPDDHKMT